MVHCIHNINKKIRNTEKEIWFVEKNAGQKGREEVADQENMQNEDKDKVSTTAYKS